MILLIFSCALTVANGKYIDKSSRKSIKASQEIRYSLADCVEKCTSLCLTDPHIYICFDQCTLQECDSDAAFTSETEDRLVYIVKFGCVILFVLLFISVICYNRHLKSNDYYWLL